MLSSFLTVLTTALSLLVVDIIFSGVNLANFPTAMVAGLAIGVVNTGIKPIISLLSLPLNILSLGAFSLIVNGLCFWLASLFVPGFEVAGFIAFVFAPIILSLANAFISKYFAEKFPALTQE